jgi:hypothetical protein
LIVHNSLLDQDGDSGFEKPTASEMPKPTNGIQVPNKEVVVPTASASTGSKQSK